MSLVLKTLPAPMVIKVEDEDEDVVCMSHTIDFLNADMTEKMFDHCVINMERSLDILLAYYKRALTKDLSLRNKICLHKAIMRHLRFFHIYHAEASKLFITMKNYYDLLEDVLVYYVILELDIAKTTKKRSYSEERYYEKLKFVASKICRFLKMMLDNKTKHCIHVLLKVSSQTPSMFCVLVQRLLYNHFLCILPTPPNPSDMIFCRHYLLMQKWKDLQKPEEYVNMDNMIFEKFNRNSKYIETNEALKKILVPQSNTEVDPIMFVIDIKNNSIRTYFKHLHEEGLLKSNYTMHSPVNLESYFTHDTPPTNGEEFKSVCSNILDSYTCDYISKKRDLISLDYGSDSDCDIFQSSSNRGNLVICIDEDSDVELIDYEKPRRKRREKGKPRIRHGLPTSFIDLVKQNEGLESAIISSTSSATEVSTRTGAEDVEGPSSSGSHLENITSSTTKDLGGFTKEASDSGERTKTASIGTSTMPLPGSDGSSEIESAVTTTSGLIVKRNNSTEASTSCEITPEATPKIMVDAASQFSGYDEIGPSQTFEITRTESESTTTSLNIPKSVQTSTVVSETQTVEESAPQSPKNHQSISIEIQTEDVNTISSVSDSVQTVSQATKESAVDTSDEHYQDVISETEEFLQFGNSNSNDNILSPKSIEATELQEEAIEENIEYSEGLIETTDEISIEDSSLQGLLILDSKTIPNDNLSMSQSKINTEQNEISSSTDSQLLDAVGNLNISEQQLFTLEMGDTETVDNNTDLEIIPDFENIETLENASNENSGKIVKHDEVPLAEPTVFEVQIDPSTISKFSRNGVVDSYTTVDLLTAIGSAEDSENIEKQDLLPGEDTENNQLTEDILFENKQDKYKNNLKNIQDLENYHQHMKKIQDVLMQNEKIQALVNMKDPYQVTFANNKRKSLCAHKDSVKDDSVRSKKVMYTSKGAIKTIPLLDFSIFEEENSEKISCNETDTNMENILSGPVGTLAGYKAPQSTCPTSCSDEFNLFDKFAALLTPPSSSGLPFCSTDIRNQFQLESRNDDEESDILALEGPKRPIKSRDERKGLRTDYIMLSQNAKPIPPLMPPPILSTLQGRIPKPPPILSKIVYKENVKTAEKHEHRDHNHKRKRNKSRETKVRFNEEVDLTFVESFRDIEERFVPLKKMKLSDHMKQHISKEVEYNYLHKDDDPLYNMFPVVNLPRYSPEELLDKHRRSCAKLGKPSSTTSSIRVRIPLEQCKLTQQQFGKHRLNGSLYKGKSQDYDSASDFSPTNSPKNKSLTIDHLELLEFKPHVKICINTKSLCVTDISSVKPQPIGAKVDDYNVCNVIAENTKMFLEDAQKSAGSFHDTLKDDSKPSLSPITNPDSQHIDKTSEPLDNNLKQPSFGCLDLGMPFTETENKFEKSEFENTESELKAKDLVNQDESKDPLLVSNNNIPIDIIKCSLDTPVQINISEKHLSVSHKDINDVQFPSSIIETTSEINNTRNNFLDQTDVNLEHQNTSLNTVVDALQNNDTQNTSTKDNNHQYKEIHISNDQNDCDIENCELLEDKEMPIKEQQLKSIPNTFEDTIETNKNYDENRESFEASKNQTQHIQSTEIYKEIIEENLEKMDVNLQNQQEKPDNLLETLPKKEPPFYKKTNNSPEFEIEGLKNNEENSLGSKELNENLEGNEALNGNNEEISRLHLETSEEAQNVSDAYSPYVHNKEKTDEAVDKNSENAETMFESYEIKSEATNVEKPNNEHHNEDFIGDGKPNDSHHVVKDNEQMGVYPKNFHIEKSSEEDNKYNKHSTKNHKKRKLSQNLEDVKYHLHKKSNEEKLPKEMGLKITIRRSSKDYLEEFVDAVLKDEDYQQNQKENQLFNETFFEGQIIEDYGTKHKGKTSHKNKKHRSSQKIKSQKEMPKLDEEVRKSPKEYLEEFVNNLVLDEKRAQVSQENQQTSYDEENIEKEGSEEADIVNERFDENTTNYYETTETLLNELNGTFKSNEFCENTKDLVDDFCNDLIIDEDAHQSSKDKGLNENLDEIKESMLPEKDVITAFVENTSKNMMDISQEKITDYDKQGCSYLTAMAWNKYAMRKRKESPSYHEKSISIAKESKNYTKQPDGFIEQSSGSLKESLDYSKICMDYPVSNSKKLWTPKDQQYQSENTPEIVRESRNYPEENHSFPCENTSQNLREHDNYTSGICQMKEDLLYQKSDTQQTVENKNQFSKQSNAQGRESNKDYYPGEFNHDNNRYTKESNLNAGQKDIGHYSSNESIASHISTASSRKRKRGLSKTYVQDIAEGLTANVQQNEVYDYQDVNNIINENLLQEYTLECTPDGSYITRPKAKLLFTPPLQNEPTLNAVNLTCNPMLKEQIINDDTEFSDPQDEFNFPYADKIVEELAIEEKAANGEEQPVSPEIVKLNLLSNDSNFVKSQLNLSDVSSVVEAVVKDVIPERTAPINGIINHVYGTAGGHDSSVQFASYTTTGSVQLSPNSLHSSKSRPTKSTRSSPKNSEKTTSRNSPEMAGQSAVLPEREYVPMSAHMTVAEASLRTIRPARRSSLSKPNTSSSAKNIYQSNVTDNSANQAVCTPKLSPSKIVYKAVNSVSNVSSTYVYTSNVPTNISRVAAPTPVEISTVAATQIASTVTAQVCSPSTQNPVKISTLMATQSYGQVMVQESRTSGHFVQQDPKMNSYYSNPHVNAGQHQATMHQQPKETSIYFQENSAYSNCNNQNANDYGDCNGVTSKVYFKQDMPIDAYANLMPISIDNQVVDTLTEINSNAGHLGHSSSDSQFELARAASAGQISNTGLPLKKRMTTLSKNDTPEPKKVSLEEISYPATPMMSIAEVEAYRSWLKQGGKFLKTTHIEAVIQGTNQLNNLQLQMLQMQNNPQLHGNIQMHGGQQVHDMNSQIYTNQQVLGNNSQIYNSPQLQGVAQMQGIHGATVQMQGSPQFAGLRQNTSSPINEATTSKQGTSRQFRTPAERKEMPSSDDTDDSDEKPKKKKSHNVYTDQYNINNHTYNKITTYHMLDKPVCQIVEPYYSIVDHQPIVMPNQKVHGLYMTYDSAPNTTIVNVQPNQTTNNEMTTNSKNNTNNQQGNQGANCQQINNHMETNQGNSVDQAQLIAKTLRRRSKRNKQPKSYNYK